MGRQVEMPVRGLRVSLLVAVVVCSPNGCDEFCWSLLADRKILYKAGPKGMNYCLPTPIRHPSENVRRLAKGRRGGSLRSTYGQDWQGKSSLLTRFAGRHFKSSHGQSESGALVLQRRWGRRAPPTTLAIGQGFKQPRTLHPSSKGGKPLKLTPVHGLCCIATTASSIAVAGKMQVECATAVASGGQVAQRQGINRVSTTAPDRGQWPGCLPIRLRGSQHVLLPGCHVPGQWPESSNFDAALES